MDQACLCGDDDPQGCIYLNSGYPYCRSCAEHHRPPECAINEQGQSLALCGCPWDAIEVPTDPHAASCRVYEVDGSLK